ncbi:MAG TPA: hypothetical protein VFP34_07835, partial [Microlunatus sp.]|nr:hypothetical protein [Microlunatus sp.]
MSGRVEGLGVGSGQSGPAPPPPSGAVQLPARGAFDHDSAFGYLARHAIPGVETVDPARRRLT